MSVELTIDGKKLTGDPGQTILEVAQENGMHIPTLCSHPKLKPTGACRVCVVDVGRKDRLEAACTTPISQGMKVETRSQRVLESRRVIVRLLLDDLNTDPENLTKDGENVLLELAEELDIKPGRKPLISSKRPSKPVDERNPVIIREPDKCILCGRCVNACNELKHYGVLNYQGRGYDSEIVSGISESLMEGGCASCGACVEVCPTGAFRPLAKELVQSVIDNVVETGGVYPLSTRTRNMRSKLGLPELKEADASELRVIAEKTRKDDETEADGGEAR